jgi:N-methylhydantoinase B/oxoprolinase/acetone carboxylase alpha subunit
MKRHLAITVVLLLSSAMFFVVVCAGADPVAVPLKGTWKGGSNFIFPAPSSCPADSVMQAIATAKGNMTHTGESEYLSPVCCNAVGQCVGTAIITAANGDALYLSVTHFFNPVTGDWSQSDVIIGGTGRFEDATGTSTSSGTSTFTGPTSDIWQGTNVGEIKF